MRVGIGYDVHRLVEEEELVLGGVRIDFSLGLKGHSDADVLIHAVMDALLGAAGAGDIGKHFPDTDPKYQGISSLKLLEEVQLFLEAEDYVVNNIDATIMAQKPKLSAFIEQMEENIAQILGIAGGKVNIKATTTEGLGFVGKKKGIAAQAIVSIK
ncbi:2-C-methyl-D-erythritol 2,4-cyclodiphosphate synthase [Fuchsiella alkaliacetigena]|uniref:2-C-methyl-D-erythritol 2,4-cyclodiphosphate synthase n=1 Tax=Fuchsiella alkaliacetigena TaxID=957042 RepID=UPI002009ED11|nr:2-C-methyl-D-erythritol 2,4-cyclodiphosphate synthase [Fuchsiella alkaliacetigena]MCK8825828.1 2-C-methyl-D-erythritol 2,4-cyclodiphosphate synthase [Fuchsiella alkaliacetigena]